MLFAAGSKFAAKPVPLSVLSKYDGLIAKLTAPLEPPPLKPLPAVTALMSPVSDMLNCPELAVRPVSYTHLTLPTKRIV